MREEEPAARATPGTDCLHFLEWGGVGPYVVRMVMEQGMR
jgi:hypothetical protein